MAAWPPAPRRKPTNRGTKSQREKDERIGVAPYLSPREVRELRARAEADLRTISNYVSHLLEEELKRKTRRRSVAGANPGEKRRPYGIALYLTAAERRRLEAAAKPERRSVSGYVGRVIVGDLTQQ